MSTGQTDQVTEELERIEFYADEHEPGPVSGPVSEKEGDGFTEKLRSIPDHEHQSQETSQKALRALRRWLIQKDFSEERAERSVELITQFYANHRLPPFSNNGDGVSGLVGFGGKRKEFGGYYLWLYNLWPIAQAPATIDDREQMYEFGTVFTEEVIRPLHPYPSVSPRYLPSGKPLSASSFEEEFRKICKAQKVKYIGVYQIPRNGETSSHR